MLARRIIAESEMGRRTIASSLIRVAMNRYGSWPFHVDTANQTYAYVYNVRVYAAAGGTAHLRICVYVGSTLRDRVSRRHD